MAKGLLIALLTSAAWIILQNIVMHIKPAANRMKAMFIGYGLSLPFIAIAYLAIPTPSFLLDVIEGEPLMLGLLHAYVMHLFVFLFYVECFYHIERAVTFRLLTHIQKHDGITSSQIRKDYDLREMVGRRLSLMEDNGFITRKNNRLQNTPKGKRFAAWMQISSWLFQSLSQKNRR